jgi:hypothetical protein
MNPIRSKYPSVTIVGPAVSSTENIPNMGLDWLSQFKGYCTDAIWDAASVHWYGPPTAGFNAFKEFVEKTIIEIGKPVWVSEFGLRGATMKESATFLRAAQDDLDSKNECMGYSYYAVSNFEPAANMFGTANALTIVGEVYTS